MSHSHRCYAEIDSDALRHNLGVVRDLAPSADVMAIVKANAYGHGLEKIVSALIGRVEMFGVATLDEARQVRAILQKQNTATANTASGNMPILLLSPALPEERHEIAVSGFLPCVSSLEEAAAYAGFAKSANRDPVSIHLKIDTGMGRIGVWQDDTLTVAKKIVALSGVRIDGVATHLPSPDEDEAFTISELEKFEQLVAALAATGIRPRFIHSLNSAGLIRFSQFAGNLVRPGLMLYGSSPIPDFQKKLKPVMTLKTRVTLVRQIGAGRSISYGRTFISKAPMRVATLAIGYGDGFPRHLSNTGAEVLIRGRRCPLLGRVTMDQILADVTALPEIAVSEEAVLIGRSGDEEILASELAEKSGTIAWEIFTNIHGRVVRI